jgi:hypothetical protein
MSDDFFKGFDHKKTSSMRRATPPPPPPAAAAAVAAKPTTAVVRPTPPSSSSSSNNANTHPRPPPARVVGNAAPSPSLSQQQQQQQQQLQQQQQQQQRRFTPATGITPIGPPATAQKTTASRINTANNAHTHLYHQPVQPQQPQQRGQPTQQSSTHRNQPTGSINPTPGPAIGIFQPQYSQSVAHAQQQPINNSSVADWTELSGAMDVAAPMTMQPAIFTPHYNPVTTSENASTYANDLDMTEPPLLEELGINAHRIYIKTKAVVLPFQRFNNNHDTESLIQDTDLAGPLALALTLGGELLLVGKLSFSYIYGFGMFGCLAMTLILNLINPHQQQQAVSLWTVTSILGYALLPVNLLALCKIVLAMTRYVTLLRVCGVVAVVWSTTASTRWLEVGCDMKGQRYLMAYPIALLYSAFVLMTIF